LVLHVPGEADRARKSDPDHNIMSMGIRSEVEELAIIEVSSSNPEFPSRKITGIVQARVKKSLTLTTGEEIAPSAAIRVQTKDILSLGQVLRCVAEPDAKWTVHVGVDRSMLVI
jgi:hypothetical protein